MARFPGVITAMVTPFAEDGSLDVAGARALASYLLENGSHGVVVAGTTGESPTLSDDEKIQLLEAVLEEIGDRATVLCGTGSNDTRHACDLTRRAAAAGAHGVLVVTPYYNKPSEAGLEAHFAAVSDAAGDTPIVMYNIPSRCVINMAPAFMASIVAANTNVVGVKQANNAEMGPIEGLEILAGNDDIFATCLERGGTGGILVAAHVVGPSMREIYEAATEGDQDRAARIESDLSAVYAAISHAPPASSVKAALSMQGLIGETQRLPMVPVDSETRDAIRDALETRGKN